MFELTTVHGPLLLVLRSSLYLYALVTEFQRRLTLASVEDVTLSPVGAGASGQPDVVPDTFEDVSPKLVDSGEPSPLALTLK